MSAHTACSREEPVPKSGPAIRMFASKRSLATLVHSFFNSFPPDLTNPAPAPLTQIRESIRGVGHVGNNPPGPASNPRKRLRSPENILSTVRTGTDLAESDGKSAHIVHTRYSGFGPASRPRSSYSNIRVRVAASGDLDPFVAEFNLRTKPATDRFNILPQRVNLSAVNVAVLDPGHPVLADVQTQPTRPASGRMPHGAPEAGTPGPHRAGASYGRRQQQCQQAASSRVPLLIPPPRCLLSASRTGVGPEPRAQASSRRFNNPASCRSTKSKPALTSGPRP